MPPWYDRSVLPLQDTFAPILPAPSELSCFFRSSLLLLRCTTPHFMTREPIRVHYWRVHIFEPQYPSTHSSGTRNRKHKQFSFAALDIDYFLFPTEPFRGTSYSAAPYGVVVLSLKSLLAATYHHMQPFVHTSSYCNFLNELNTYATDAADVPYSDIISIQPYHHVLTITNKQHRP